MSSELPPHVQAYIDRVVAEAPPLRQDQRDALAELLSPVRIRPRDVGSDAA